MDFACELPPFEKGGFWGRTLNTTKFTERQCPSSGLAHDSPYLGDLPQGSSTYIEGSISVCILLHTTSGAFKQPVMIATSLAEGVALPASLRSVGFVHLDHSNAAPVRLVFNVSSELPEGPRVQLSIEPPAFSVGSDVVKFSNRDDGI